MSDSRTIRLVPPTGWGATAQKTEAPRLDTLEGLTIGLLSNGKANGVELLDRVADELVTRHSIARVIRHTKPHPSLPMSDEVLTMFAEQAHAVLTAVGD
jgi:hypothetical protein